MESSAMRRQAAAARGFRSKGEVEVKEGRMRNRTSVGYLILALLMAVLAGGCATLSDWANDGGQHEGGSGGRSCH